MVHDRYEAIPGHIKRAEPDLVRRRGVVVEVKPHTKEGISSGLKQLREYVEVLSRGRGRSLQPVLLTYRPAETPRGRSSEAVFHVLIADPKEVAALIADRKAMHMSAPRTWYRLDDLWFDASQKITLAECPTVLGARIQNPVTRLYARYFKIPTTWSSKDPHLSGPDWQHEELAEFLRELADQVEAESGVVSESAPRWH